MPWPRQQRRRAFVSTFCRQCCRRAEFNLRANPVQPPVPRLDARNADRCWLGPTWPTCPPFLATLIESVEAVTALCKKRQRSFFSSSFDFWLDRLDSLDRYRKIRDFLRPT
jgi:hypothetical protein